MSRLSLAGRALVFVSALILTPMLAQSLGVSGSSIIGLVGLALGVIAIPVGLGELVAKALQPAVWIDADLVRKHVLLGRSHELASADVVDLRVEDSRFGIRLHVATNARRLGVPIRFDGDIGVLQAELRKILGLR